MESFENILFRETATGRKNETTYQYLNDHNNDSTAIGIYSEYRGDKLYHCLAQDMLISVLQYNYEEKLKVSIYSASFPVNYQLLDAENPVHYNDFIELTYVLQGHITVMIDHEMHTFQENELYLISPNILYCESKNISQAIVFNISIRKNQFDEMLLSDIKKDSLQDFLRSCLLHEKNIRKFLYFSPNEAPNRIILSDLISSIFMEYKQKKPGYLFIVKGSLIRLLDFLASHYSFTFSEDTKKKYSEILFREVKKYIIEHCQDIQMKDLIHNFHYQGNYFNKLIHDFTGMSYSEYLIFIRIELAKELLVNSKLSIENIMAKIGYHNKGFFYKIFRQNTGMTPAAYRKNVKCQPS